MLFSRPGSQYIISRATISPSSTTTKAIEVFFYTTAECVSPTQNTARPNSPRSKDQPSRQGYGNSLEGGSIWE
jgi:hypothetical protein